MSAPTQYVLQRQGGELPLYVNQLRRGDELVDLVMTLDPARAARFPSATEAALFQAKHWLLSGFEVAPAPSQEAASS